MFGLVYMELRENKLAEQSFERALRLAPNDPDINHNYGWFLCQTEREPESIKYFLQAIRNPLYPTPWRSYSAAGHVQRCGQATSRTPRSSSSARCKLEPDEPGALLQLGQIRYQQGSIGRRAQAGVALQQAGRRRPPSRCGSRCASSAGSASASPSRASPTSCAGASPTRAEYQALQRGEFD